MTLLMAEWGWPFIVLGAAVLCLGIAVFLGAIALIRMDRRLDMLADFVIDREGS